jgi:hypothetical protein
MMAGPMIAKDEIHRLLGITQPWRMVGAIALGHLATAPSSSVTRKPIDKVATWFEGDASV